MWITEDTLDLFQGAETGEPVRVDETLLLRRGSHPRMIAKVLTNKRLFVVRSMTDKRLLD
jgi:hypothetical protein